MTTYPTLKIVYGNRSIDLNDRVNFYVRTDLVPPETNLTAQIATGSALNVAGGRMVARKPQTRAWSFSVRVVGTTDAEIVNQLRGVKALLAMAGDANEPVKIVYSPNSDTPEPVWGQFGALLNYEVLDGSITIGPDYMKGARRAKAVVATFNLTIQPYATGKQQRVCSALGGVLEDKLGTVDGLSRGLGVPEATTNLHTNPVFGNSTYDTGWTTGSSLFKTQVTDAAFVPFGFSGAKLSTYSTTNNHFTQSLTLTAASYRLSYYVVAPDRSALSATQVQVSYDGVAQSSTYTSLGNGLYVVEASVTGTAAAHTCGIVVKQYATVIIVGAQCELKAYRTPLAHGDLLGCAWSSTAHASSTTRTAARVSVPTAGLLSAAPFTVRLVWKTGPSISASAIVLDARDGSHTNALYVYLTAAPAVGLSFGAGSVAGGPTLAANTTYIVHATWSGQTLTLYVNGSSVGGTGLSALTDQGASLFVGTDYSTANHAGGTFGGVAIFDVALSATQVANDYANAAAVVADGARVESVPWLWTKDGDNVVDNCNDSTRDNWCVVGGVGGTAEAETLLDVTASALDTTVLIGLNAVDQWVDPGSYLYADFSGTADANSSGGAYKASTIDTSGLVSLTVLTIQDNPIRFLAFSGREFMPLLRVYDVGASAVNYRWLPYGAAGYEFTNTQTLAAAWQMARLLPFRTLNKQDVFGAVTGENVTISLVPKRATGSADIRLDYVMLMPKPMISIAYPFSAASPSLLIQGLNVVEYLPASSNRFMIPKPAVTGDVVELRPDRLNTLIVNVGATITNTVTFNSIKVKPRWQLV